MQAVVDVPDGERDHVQGMRPIGEGQGFQVSGKNHKPVEIAPHVFQLGTPAFPAYLSLGEEGMIIEEGAGASEGLCIQS